MHPAIQPSGPVKYRCGLNDLVEMREPFSKAQNNRRREAGVDEKNVEAIS